METTISRYDRVFFLLHHILLTHSLHCGFTYTWVSCSSTLSGHPSSSFIFLFRVRDQRPNFLLFPARHSAILFRVQLCSSRAKVWKRQFGEFQRHGGLGYSNFAASRSTHGTCMAQEVRPLRPQDSEWFSLLQGHNQPVLPWTLPRRVRMYSCRWQGQAFPAAMHCNALHN